MKNEVLASLAREARSLSYCPYSGMAVGAALLCASGKVYLGANIENAAFTPTVCAERTAIFRALLDGERDFLRIAVCGGRAGDEVHQSFPPCGVCRQVLAEFCSPELEILLVGDKIEVHTLGELLPATFSKENMD